MKNLIVSCLAISVMLVLSDAAENPLDYRKAVEDCLKGMKLTDEVYAKIAGNNDDRKFYCILACADKKINSFDGKKMNAEMIHEETKAERAEKGLEYTENMKNAMEKCIDKANNHNGDECEITEVYFKCAFEDKELKEIMTKDGLQKLITDVREKIRSMV